DRLPDARARLQQLESDTERATESYNGARVRLGQLSAEQLRVASSLLRLQGQVDHQRQHVAQVAVAAYKQGPVSLGAIVDSESLNALVERSRYLDAVAGDQRAALERLRVAQSDLEAERGHLSEVEAGAEREVARLDADKQLVESLLTDQQGLVARYQA